MTFLKITEYSQKIQEFGKKFFVVKFWLLGSFDRMVTEDLFSRVRIPELLIKVLLGISALSILSFPFLSPNPDDLLLSILRYWGEWLKLLGFSATAIGIFLTWRALSRVGWAQSIAVFVAGTMGLNLVLSAVAPGQRILDSVVAMLGVVTSAVIGIGLIGYAVVTAFGFDRLQRVAQLLLSFVVEGIRGVWDVVSTLGLGILSGARRQLLGIFGRGEKNETKSFMYVKRHTESSDVDAKNTNRFGQTTRKQFDNLKAGNNANVSNPRKNFEEIFRSFRNKGDDSVGPTNSYESSEATYSEPPCNAGVNLVEKTVGEDSETLGSNLGKIVRFGSNRMKKAGNYRRPNLSIFVPRDKDQKVDKSQMASLAERIEESLKEFNVTGKIKEVHPGPVVTTFEFEPAPGIKVGKVATLQDDLAMSLKAHSIRIVAPIPKKGTIGIEVPNKTRYVVRLRSVLESQTFQHAPDLALCLGEDTVGEPVVVDLATMPHLLIAGATGTGKSVCINSLLISLLYKNSPENLGLILIDPKVLELSIYDGLPHLKAPVITEAKKAKAVLQWAVAEMERRYKFLQKFGVRNIDSFNSLPNKEAGALSKLVIIIDELADLMFSVGKEIEELIIRLAQKARAAGIHLIMATQRPSVDVVTGLIKANFPARISFRVVTRVDSRTILDQMGAEKLLGKGDMLVMLPGGLGLKRVHGAFVSDEEVQRFVDEIKLNGSPNYEPEILELLEAAERQETALSIEVEEDSDEELYRKALEIVVQKGQASTSMIQRALRIGYNRAARIVEKMEQEGFLGASDGVRPREVLYQNIKKVYPHL